MSWYTEGKKTNPSSGCVLAETSQYGSPTTATANFMLAANVSATMVIAVRNAADNADTYSQEVYLSAVSTAAPPPFSIPVGTNEKIVVRTSGTTLGSVQASIFA